MRLIASVASTTVASPEVATTTSARSRRVLTSGMTCGDSFTGDIGGETDVHR